jgi:ferric-dicitrate binding protein FerR (iron transport regulator)
MPMTTYATARGQRATITLPDGVRVSLDVASRLDVPSDYLNGNHVLHLQGSALFDVKHHTSQPLQIVTDDAIARVLGTSFMVRHYMNDTSTTVAVRAGKVSVQSVVLTALQMMEVAHGRILRLQPADPGEFAFASGVLTINNKLLRDAIPELNRWYDADIRLGDAALDHRRITGGFSSGSTADFVQMMEWTFGMRVIRDGQVITLYSR